jgi:hypothetical protein
MNWGPARRTICELDTGARLSSERTRRILSQEAVRTVDAVLTCSE